MDIKKINKERKKWHKFFFHHIEFSGLEDFAGSVIHFETSAKSLIDAFYLLI